MVDLEMLGEGLAQLVVIIGGLAAAYLGLVRWMRRVTRASEGAEQQLRTSNGKTTGQLVESSSRTLVELREEMRTLDKWAERRANHAAARIEQLEERVGRLQEEHISRLQADNRRLHAQLRALRIDLDNLRGGQS